MSEKTPQITISVDDGHPLDLKLASVFKRVGIAATFYVPIKRWGSRVLSRKQIRELGREFEIGAHTYNHIDLAKVNKEKAMTELVDGKEALEDMLGHKITSFAFPFGHYDNQLVGLVRNAGYKNCRSGRIINFNRFDKNQFLQHPNLHIYPHKLTTDLVHCLKYKDVNSLIKRVTHSNKSHLELFEVLDRKKPLHLWCHSQDIAKFNLWSFFYRLKSVGG